MSDWISCQGCGLKHAPRDQGRCPRCGAPTGTGVPAGEPPRAAAPTGAGSSSSRGAGRAFAHEAARASWLVPLVVVPLTSVFLRSSYGLAADLFAMLFVLAGLVLAAIALAGIRKHGREGILVPALAGVLVNGLLIFIFVSNALASRG